MAITTYDFYTNEYYGNTISQDSFDKWLSKATDKINYLCYGRINEDAVETFPQIKKAVCALADAMYLVNDEMSKAGTAESGNIRSISSGSESISFGSDGTAITNALASTGAQNRYYLDVIAEYLSETGLMYAGV